MKPDQDKQTELREKIKKILTFEIEGLNNPIIAWDQIDKIEALFQKEVEDRVEEIIGEEKSVEELLETMGVPPYNDLASQVAFKEGYNAKGREIKSRLTKQEK